VSRAGVSLCLIARNEEANLPACLESVGDLVDEIVLVDTGSTDRTKEIAAHSGARVHEFAWVDDFAVARNESIRHATGKWIFWLDCDDRVDESERPKLRSLFGQLNDENVGYLMTVSSTGWAGVPKVVVDQVRLFPNRPEVRWQYRVHEQITLAIVRSGGTLRPTDVVIRHSGYAERSVYTAKLDRNLRLLYRDQVEHPDDPNILFHMGWTYYAMNRPADALPLLQRSIQLTAPLELISLQYSVMALCYRALGQEQQGFAVCKEGRSQFPDDPDLLAYESGLRWKYGDLQGSKECLARLLALLPQMRGSIAIDAGPYGNTVRKNLAVICFSQGRHGEAEAYWRAILATQPDAAYAWMGLSDCWLAEGRTEELQAAAQELEAVPERTADAALLWSRLHLANRNFPAARRVLEDTIARLPGVFYPRVILSEVLCQEGADWPAAEKALRDLLARDPDYSPAREKLRALLQQQGRSE
jgi:tetratricopeptide (TPR) repeat protein